ncbi:MAG: hypothetical protein V4493_01100 [Pseudomonadota bacterium]
MDEIETAVTEWMVPSIKAKSPHVGKIKTIYDFPFRLVPEGKSFMVKLDEVSSLNVLRTTASRWAQRLKCKFRVIDHSKEYACFEVYHIPKHEYDMNWPVPVGTVQSWQKMEQGNKL